MSVQSAVPVLNDAQFTTTRLLRPAGDWVNLNQGQPCQTMIMFTEDEQILAPEARAGDEGYSVQLVQGEPVPLGSTVLLWLPTISYLAGDSGLSLRWAFFWRLRNLFDFRQKRTPWHIPRQGVGSDDNVAIPAALQTVTYIQAEPAAAGTRAVQSKWAEDITIPFDAWTAPAQARAPIIEAGVAGWMEQGINRFESNTSYMPYLMQALGDELLIGAYRNTDDPANVDWDFAGTDTAINFFFNDNEQAAVYLLTGTPLSHDNEAAP